MLFVLDRGTTNVMRNRELCNTFPFVLWILASKTLTLTQLLGTVKASGNKLLCSGLHKVEN